jgi:hypothetical protein
MKRSFSLSSCRWWLCAVTMEYCILPSTSAVTTLLTTASWSSASIDEATSLEVGDCEHLGGWLDMCDLPGCFGVRVKGLDDLCYCDRLFILPPCIVVSRSGNERVTGTVQPRDILIAESTDLSSASRASFASGRTLMLMISPPHARYMWLSALVENRGPSIHTTVFFVCSEPCPASSKTLLTKGAMNSENLLENGSPNVACATMRVPWKKVERRVPLVLSMIWSGMMKSPGRISSRRDPTAENARIAFTPICLSAAILAAEGTSEGETS